ncbi:MAG: hypothetical protein MZU97_24145 [Bacillus subtilis]|nr:hypothetical protein [Bacillus subtilis]
MVNLSIGTNRLNVAGVIFQVSTGRYIKNILNQGNVTVAKIAGTGTITGTSPNFVTNTGGIFIAGIANQNYAGDLHLANVTQASLGIINSINYGTVSTSYGLQAQNLFGISGSTNTFAAGIATLNAGSIQDVANLGDVGAYNSTVHATSTIQVSAGGSTSTTAGVMFAYLGGVTSAGVVAVTLSGQARVYDSANIGDIMAMAYRYSRAGGILAISLYSEALAGGITTANSGLANTIQGSILSNGLNYGNVTSLTNQISQYTTAVAAANFTFEELIDTRTVHPIRLPAGTGSEDRPGIYSSAGGVIGYGLCTMVRMMNHGTISATDVAGGIVGATYVTGDGVTTIVNINTAINYGKIKAVINTKVMQDADSINPYALDPSSISEAFYPDESSFIFGSLSETWRRLTPSNRRGFGGIFGRLQRGYAGIMTSTGGSFSFVVNTDANVDLVGRLDQLNTFTGSANNYSFIDAIYYTTRLNDSTQYVFTGFYFAWAALANRQGTTNAFTYTATPITWYRRVGASAAIATVPNAPATFITLPSATSLTTGNRYTIYGVSVIPKISGNFERRLRNRRHVRVYVLADIRYARYSRASRIHLLH